MRVAGVEFHNHPALGTFQLDFRDASGNAPATVVIAGENGCGKTAILETIFLALGPNTHGPLPAEAPFGATVFVAPHPEIAGVLRGNKASTDPADPNSIWATFEGFGIRLLFPKPDNRTARVDRYLWDPMTGNIIDFPDTIKDTLGDLGCFLSEANTAFNVPEIVAATGKVQRPTSHAWQDWMRGGAKLAEEIAQLIVDLRTADNNEAAEWLRTHPQGRPPDDLVDRRIGPLTRAFARLFEGKTFAGIDTSGGDLRPMFEQFGRRMPLARLSTGEKQVVFRGAFLLREAEALDRAVVLVDEPELSLHPIWQSKVLPFYEAIVAREAGAHNQIIVATHSPFVVHGSPAAKHIILRRDRTDGHVYADPEAGYRGVTSGDTAIAAFDLAEFSFKQQGVRLAILTEGPTDAAILEVAWKASRGAAEMPFVPLPARGAASIPSLLGTAEDVEGPFQGAVTTLGIERFIGLFDFDGEGYGHWNGVAKIKIADDESLDLAGCSRRRRRGCLTWAALLPVPIERRGYASHEFGPDSKLTIELLFPDERVEPLLEYAATPGGGRVLKARTAAQKRAVAEACRRFPPEAFAAFEPIWELVDHVLSFTPAA